MTSSKKWAGVEKKADMAKNDMKLFEFETQFC